MDVVHGYHRILSRCTSIEAISMRAMVLTSPRTPLEWTELPDRSPEPDEIRVKVSACGVCRTDLHVIDGELAHPKLPLVPGHEVVGRIDALGAHVDSGLELGDRVGIPWLAHTCGVCSYCIHGHENLCDEPHFTGYTCDGGFATSIIANARYAFPLPEGYSDAALAPLLCAGLIGWRSLVRAGSAQHIGMVPLCSYRHEHHLHRQAMRADLLDSRREVHSGASYGGGGFADSSFMPRREER
jgi:alcohol dehydrogenase, propanol-preferring